MEHHEEVQTPEFWILQVFINQLNLCIDEWTPKLKLIWTTMLIPNELKCCYFRILKSKVLYLLPHRNWTIIVTWLTELFLPCSQYIRLIAHQDWDESHRKSFSLNYSTISLNRSSFVGFIEKTIMGSFNKGMSRCTWRRGKWLAAEVASRRALHCSC